MESNTWYLEESGNLEKSYRIPGRSLSEEEKSDAIKLLDLSLQVAKDLGGTSRYRIQAKLDDGREIIARGQRVTTTDSSYHILREIPLKLPELTDKQWRYPTGVQRMLLDPSLNRGGLLLVCGAGGSGKSTTIAATLVSRLKAYGSIAFTVEDPPEYPMNGLQGRGVCFQLSDDDDFRERIHEALRGYPAGMESAILLIGEIRAPEVAALAIEAALSGLLVLTTIHGMSIESGLARLESLAGTINGRDSVRRDLADSFRMALHQRLVRNNGAMEYQATILTAKDTDSVPAKIRESNYHALASEIARQNVLLKNGQSS